MNNLLKFKWCLYVLCILVINAAADQDIEHHSAGTSMFPFLDMEYDARSLAMGSAAIGVQNGLCGVFSNPAAVHRLKAPSGLVTYRPVILDIRSGSFAYGFPFKDYGVVAVNMVYLSAGTIDEVDRNNQPMDVTWHPYSVSGSVVYSTRIFNSMGVGVALKGIYERIGNDDTHSSADGFAVDAGWQYSMHEIDLSYGVIIKNLGLIRSGYSTERDDGPLPFTVGTGLSYRPDKVSSLLFAFDMEKSIDDYLEYAVGAEAELFDKALMIRAGYAFSHRDLVWLFGGDRDEDSYQKTNWKTVSAGIGLVTELADAEMVLDAALDFRTDGLPPSYALTVQVGL